VFGAKNGLPTDRDAFGGARLTGVFRVYEAAWLKMHVSFSLGTQKGSVEVLAGPRNQILKYTT
jgi:hypothetical protein